MGASNSTRKITLVNDEKAGVIKLSESLAHRLRGQIENGHASDKESFHPIPQASPPAPVTPQHVLAPPSSPPVASLPPKNVPPQIPAIAEGVMVTSKDDEGKSSDDIPPWSLYAKEAHLIASRIREEKEAELRLKDEQWRMKLQQREKEYTEMAKLSEDHLQGTMKEVETLFTKVSCTPVCQDQQQNVMSCYKDNSKQTLRCSDEVENFARCVDLSRLQSMMRERVA